MGVVAVLVGVRVRVVLVQSPKIQSDLGVVNYAPPPTARQAEEHEVETGHRK